VNRRRAQPQTAVTADRSPLSPREANKLYAELGYIHSPGIPWSKGRRSRNKKAVTTGLNNARRICERIVKTQNQVCVWARALFGERVELRGIFRARRGTSAESC
jgi:hypothetical protein